MIIRIKKIFVLKNILIIIPGTYTDSLQNTTRAVFTQEKRGVAHCHAIFHP